MDPPLVNEIGGLMKCIIENLAGIIATHLEKIRFLTAHQIYIGYTKYRLSRILLYCGLLHRCSSIQSINTGYNG